MLPSKAEFRVKETETRRTVPFGRLNFLNPLDESVLVGHLRRSGGGLDTELDIAFIRLRSSVKEFTIVGDARVDEGNLKAAQASILGHLQSGAWLGVSHLKTKEDRPQLIEGGE